MNIQMVDLKSQYQHIKTEVDAAVLSLLDQTAFIGGPTVKQFETNLAAYLGANHVISCANGTDALQIALMALDLQPGDEVIVPAFTYVATAEVIALLQLTPVMVDVEPDTFLVTPQIVEAAITPRTKAVVPVNLFGQAVDLSGIMQVAEKHGIYVIEDNAQAIGADFVDANGNKQKAGTVGHIGCTSFYPSKNLGCYGDGGAISTQDEALAAKMRMIANHGQSRRYYHDLVGVNSRLDTIQAAILDIKLKHLNSYNQRRQEAAAWYDEGFAEITQLTTPRRASYSTHVFHQYTLLVADGKRDALQAWLQEKGIPTMIYYPVPLYEQAAFKKLAGSIDFLPVTDALCKAVISLPMHSELTQEQVSYIVEQITSFFSA